MQSERATQLEAAVSQIQRRWGVQALQRRATPMPPVPDTLSTGYAMLDHGLAIGGLPCGEITELLGYATGGYRTLALHTAAAAQRAGKSVIYLDMDAIFDPEYAAGCGVALSRLLLVRPPTPEQALEMTLEVVRQGAGLVVWDSLNALAAFPNGERLLAQALPRLARRLAASGGVALFLAQILTPAWAAGTPLLQSQAAVRLRLQTTRWLEHQGTITGYEVTACVLRNRHGPAGGKVLLPVSL